MIGFSMALVGAAALLILGVAIYAMKPQSGPRPIGRVSILPEDKAELRRIRDISEINAGRCPDCGSHGSLCGGPSGGMSQNIACDKCHMEFNVHQGFGTGAFKVDRTGRLSEQRARRTFGFQDADFPPQVQQ